MREVPGWVYVGLVVLFTVYAQLVIKWQVDGTGTVGTTGGARIGTSLRLLLNPWVISAFAAAGVAALCWIMALSHYELSKAYPFMGLTFVIVVLAGSALFGEDLTVPKIIGTLCVVGGLAIAAQ
jgi:multidrug transporter EmrE-like cation transporter